VIVADAVEIVVLVVDLAAVADVIASSLDVETSLVLTNFINI
jgi:hypothetical protein